MREGAGCKKETLSSGNLNRCGLGDGITPIMLCQYFPPLLLILEIPGGTGPKTLKAARCATLINNADDPGYNRNSAGINF